MKRYVRLLGLALLAGGLAASPPVEAGEAKSAFDADREAILAMSGDFRVAFRFDENLTLYADSPASKRHYSRAFETVRVLEDTGDFISLQHLLLTERDGEWHVVKHWRQDWQFEPVSHHVFRGDYTWERVELTEAERRGAWSQTVYQVDDSPRYAGIGRWEHSRGYPYWESNPTWRPLPRREKKERDDYDVLEARNRHGLTADGWVHEQDNAKLALEDGTCRLIARERGLNTYTRVDDFDFSPATAYWDETGAFWASVRASWRDILARHSVVSMTLPDGEESHEAVWDIVSKLRDDALTLSAAQDAYRDVVRKTVYTEPQRTAHR